MGSLSRITIVAIGLTVLASTAIADDISLVRIQKMTKQQYLSMAVMGLDVIETKDEEFKILAKPADLQRLEQAGIPFIVEEPDIKAFYKSRFREGETMGGFRTYSEIVAYLDTLTSDYPSITTDKFSIGTSIEGRDLWVVKISDNPDIDEDEPEILYISLIHAREPCAGAAVLHLMEHFLSNYGVDPEITDLVDSRELYFLPVQNPDGYVYNQQTDPNGGGMWRKNRRNNGDGEYGVDCNRNYGYKWGYDNMGSSPSTWSETYRGTGPFSEPETDLVKDFVISRNFVIIHNFHTYSNLEIWPYGYDRFFTYEEDFFKNLGDSMTMFNGYDPGVSWTLYPTNGDADDWGWGDTISKPRNISLTVEIGGSSDGFWPNPSRIPTLVAENVWPSVFLAKIADNPYVIAPPKAPTATSPDSAGNDFTVEWQVVDSVNPPQSYRLMELTDRQTVTDDAESDYGYWETVRMALSGYRKHSGSSSWLTQTDNRAHHWLVSTTPYEVLPDDSLKFWTWYAIENGWDYFYVQVSTDGGFIFTNLANDLTTNDDPQGLNLGNGITGFSGDWVYAKFDLSAYVGQQVLFRFAYFTDHYYTEEGVYLDDIENVDLFGSETEIGSGITDTFYTFISKPVGDYWYRVAAADAQSQGSRLSNLVHTTVYEGLLVGDADGNGSINVADVTFLVDYLFFGGPPPDPKALGDVDCSGSINVGDVTFLVNYLFFGGPPPDC
jgi:hypothetical protein